MIIDADEEDAGEDELAEDDQPALEQLVMEP
jgi:hypothetical protein